jgi:2-iminobutanoate/2-iminopropanoate deaminase
MTKKTINLKDDLKNRIFSDSVMDGNVLYISGQVGTAEGEDNSFEKQFRRVFEKLSSILKKADMSLENVLRVGVYLKERSDFQKMNQLFTEYFPKNPPARSTIITNLVNENMLVEIDAIASR